MVLIEPKQETLNMEVPKPEAMPEQKSTWQEIIEKSKEISQGMVQNTKKVVANIKIKSPDTPISKAEFYTKKCWNHMAMNEVSKAREMYEKLVAAYEEMPEGPDKTNTYYEVYDIYQRLNEVR